MNAQRRDYSYDDLFPERWLHAPDLDGRTVTLTITAAYAEFIENPKKHKKDDAGELCGVLSFKGTKREYVLSKQNAWILKALWGKDAAEYVGKRITLAPVPDSSGFTEHGTRILFVGSPDIEDDLSLNLPGGKHLTFKKTAAGKQTVDEASVDMVTGEVAEEATGDAGTGLDGVESEHGSLYAETAFEAPESPDSAEMPEDANELDLALQAEPTPLRKPRATQAQLKTIAAVVRQSGIYEAEYVALLDSYGAGTAEELTKENAEYVLAALRERSQ